MCGLKCNVRVLTIGLIIQSGYLISTGSHNGAAEILWYLSNRAIGGKQASNSPKQYPTEFQLHPERFSQYTGPIKLNLSSRDQYGFAQNHINDNQYPNIPRPTPLIQKPQGPYPVGFTRPPPALPPGYHQYQQNLGYPPQSFTEALQSIAHNDNLRCVSRLLCELTSGSTPVQQKELTLPFNINMDSLITLLSAVTAPQSFGLLEFGKAVLLGYTSKGGTNPCFLAYPQCPQDPDRLVDYLNNYNGGFFRYFNGLPPQNHQHLFPSFHLPNYQRPTALYDPHYYQRIQKRILTKPLHNLDLYQNDVRFPENIKNYARLQNGAFVFPQSIDTGNNLYNSISGIGYRKEKAVSFPQLNIQFEKPLPNTKKVNMIFPDRTGTGELRLDLEDLEYNYNKYNLIFGRY